MLNPPTDKTACNKQVRSSGTSTDIFVVSLIYIWDFLRILILFWEKACYINKGRYEIYTKFHFTYFFQSLFQINIFVIVAQLVSHVWLFATAWTAACWASLSITNSQSLLKLMSIESVMESVMPSNHLILCHPHLLLPSIFSFPA